MISIQIRLKSQEISFNAALEGVLLTTDRNMYVSGEKIMFSSVVISLNKYDEVEMNRIIIVELITPEGSRVTGGKFLVENQNSMGCLQIPEETSTGNYYLKSYTRWMRNGSTENYNYVLLKIIHPSKSEILNGKDNFDSISFDRRNFEKTNDIKIVTDQSSYSSGDKIQISISSSGKCDSTSKISLTLAPEASIDLDKGFVKKTNPSSIISTSNLQYYPEFKGVSLSGKLLDKNNKQALAGTKINLSVLGDKDIMVTGTDSAGRFFFSLPDYYGNRDLFLSAENQNDISSEIFIDNDFCIRPVNLPSPLFILSEAEKVTALNLVINHTIQKKFQNISIENEPEINSDSNSFYGVPSEVLMLENYIDLPTLEDYFNELPLMVKVRKTKGKKHFRFYTTQGEMAIFDPLVLIDWVAVNDADRILAMPPREIKRIELINAPYVKGNIVYGGIVSFISKKYDFAGIDLPTSGTFIRYRFLEECDQEPIQESFGSHRPDARNTIYWNPEITLDEKGETEIYMSAPETSGCYVLLLREMNKNAGIKQRWIEIEIKGSE
ncbi:MAG: hypothetical protein CVT92_03760 [Bacteroidetes bacterium HGW-Bacteroidetes-1]|jgi:hypothetical protein|nr:MAG: hypothetical protein CVT92_03760 [Bacteroidetes bacterium HGW-Bacteroidetes-1]